MVGSDGDATDDVDTKLSELRSVVAYLRKEKEIVDLQLELSKQENVRLKSQIDHLSQTLDETRKVLSEVFVMLSFRRWPCIHMYLRSASALLKQLRQRLNIRSFSSVSINLTSCGKAMPLFVQTARLTRSVLAIWNLNSSNCRLNWIQPKSKPVLQKLNWKHVMFKSNDSRKKADDGKRGMHIY